MAFEDKKYLDGEASFKTPLWRRRIESAHAGIGELSYSEMLKEQRTFQQNEVGLKHPTNGSSLRITDSGAIELFTGYGTGIRISNNETMQLFADNIQLIGRETKISSQPNETNVNGKQLAGDYPSLSKKGLTDSFLDLLKESNHQ